MKPSDSGPHPGISMHRIQIGAGTAGVLVMIGAAWACFGGPSSRALVPADQHRVGRRGCSRVPLLVRAQTT
jgi:hypothetical protein